MWGEKRENKGIKKRQRDDEAAELGTQQNCRDNVTMFSGHKVVCYCNIIVFVVATPSRHRDRYIFRIFSDP